MLKVAIIGFGGIAQAAHLPAYRNLQEQNIVKLVAVCDIDPQRFTQKMQINIGSGQAGNDLKYNCYTDWEEMLAREEIDVVDVCLPTFLHAEVVIELLKRGYHVFSEKPMARDYEQCMAMVEAAKNCKGQLMIGQCLRFASAYTFLKNSIEANTFGKPISAVFRRISGPPVWGWDNWFMDHQRSGGCLLDMHIHDIDIIRFLFGEPKAVSCVTQDVYSKDDIVYSRLEYDGFNVLAIGDWSQEGVDFLADYRVIFEKATVVLENNIVTVYPRGGEKYTLKLGEKSFYQAEIEYFIDLVRLGAVNTVITPSNAAMTIKLMETLRESARKRGCIIPFEKE